MGKIIGYFIIGILCSILLLPFYMIAAIIAGKKSLPFFRHLSVFSLIGCIGVIIFATLLIGGIDLSGSYHLLNIEPFVWTTKIYAMGFRDMMIQLISNILMFIPLAFFLATVFPKCRNFKNNVCIIFCTTLTIECIQYFIGRSADIDDIIMNVTGGLLGYALYQLANFLLKNKKGWKKMNGVYL